MDTFWLKEHFIKRLWKSIDIFLISPQKRTLWAGVRNYQILLLVHGQANGQNPLVQVVAVMVPKP